MCIIKAYLSGKKKIYGSRENKMANDNPDLFKAHIPKD